MVLMHLSKCPALFKYVYWFFFLNYVIDIKKLGPK